MPQMKFPHHWSKGQCLTHVSTPGSFFRIQEVRVDRNEVIYDLHVIGTFEVISSPASDVEAHYRLLTSAEYRMMDQRENPSEPEDPDFDPDGFPIYRPDHI